ncbi:MutS domain V domain containing protein [Acanthamoeba castellanii str. Neff]|uniref:MutS domain V domain containing protein n=2 Tax=Acanthamoeba castellanii TaxID=5755 RepID=L8GJ43_ACACF|nr:MutS domain V domain containing protein [Acanthamoeba castellanii str. Neff]ELR12869.1 MutS domain V domain containing protein [Acanthamoeba castellanii str. Neff]
MRSLQRGRQYGLLEWGRKVNRAKNGESTSELSLCEVFEHEEDFSRLQLLENETHIFPVEFIKSSEYAYEASKRKMLLLKLPGMPSDLTQQDRLQFFSSLVPLDQTQMIVNELESNDEPIAIGKLSLLPVAGAMRIDMDTLKALSVFSTETHPSSHGIGKPKEGFSLFSLYRPHTPLGKRLLSFVKHGDIRKWFLLPQTTTALLHDRLQHIDYLTRLFQSLIGCIRIKELCEPHELRLFKQVVASFNEPLYDLVHTLASTIDFEASKEFGRLTIKEGVCPSLDELRSIYQNLDSLLTSFAKEELTTLASPLVTSLSIVYYPQVGYQVVIPQRPDVALGELVKCATLEYQFHTTKYAYFKNSFMRELDQSDELGVQVVRADTLRIKLHPHQGDDSHVLLLSGANGSGKSVYLKQVGLIVFLAHIGSFVPADEATIGLTDQIFSRIYSRETASVQVSSFMIDLNQVAAMLRHATGRSLLLLDEFGKGTNVVDGVSVLGGALHHLLSREETPKAIVSTHLGEYFDNQTLLPETRALSFVHMDVFVKEDDAQRDVVFLYKYALPSTAPSLAATAKPAGLPRDKATDTMWGSSPGFLRPLWNAQKPSRLSSPRANP